MRIITDEVLMYVRFSAIPISDKPRKNTLPITQAVA